MEKQTCIMCGKTKPLEDYYTHPQMANGRLGRCKVCHRSEAKRVRDENIEKARAYDRERAILPHRRAMQKEKWKRRRAEDKNIDRSHNAIRRAVASGKLIRPDHCSRCKITCFPQAHHDDYSKPLDIMWLCPVCHAERHRELGRLSKPHPERTP